MTPRRSLRLESALAAWIARRPCDNPVCRKPLGNAPRQISRYRHYHPACKNGGSDVK